VSKKTKTNNDFVVLMAYMTTKTHATVKTSSKIHNFIAYACDKVCKSVDHVFQAFWKLAPTLQLSSILPHIQWNLAMMTTTKAQHYLI
jgi:hypothetical protein